jgi:hypothetical protein
MDPHAVLVRHRAARTLEALAAVQKAYRVAITTPAAQTPRRDGHLNAFTEQAREHPRTLTISAAEAHALLRTSTPRNARKPERKAHLELHEALALALVRLGEVTTPTAPREALAAARLAARKLARWLAEQEKRAAAPASLPVSKSMVLAPKKGRSHSVPTPCESGSPQAAPASAREAVHQQHEQTKAQNSARRRHFLAVRAATRAAAAAASAAAAAGAAAPAVLPLTRLPTPRQETTRPCPPASTSPRSESPASPTTSTAQARHR